MVVAGPPPQVCRELSEEYDRLVNPDRATEDAKPLKVKDEPLSDNIAFPVSEEPEADLASGDQALPTPSERVTGGLEGDSSPHPSGTYLGRHLAHRGLYAALRMNALLLLVGAVFWMLTIGSVFQE